MKPLAACRLYGFVDAAYLAGRDPAELARQLCDGGADLIQLRAKSADLDAVRRTALALGQEDFFEAGHRHLSELRTPGRPAEFGLSSHAPDQARRAVEAGADYVAVGPVFPTGTKPGRPAVTLEYVRWAAAHLTVPWFAIGGITLENLDSVLEAGATRVCVVSALLNAPNVTAACRSFHTRLASAAPYT